MYVMIHTFTILCSVNNIIFGVLKWKTA